MLYQRARGLLFLSNSPNKPETLTGYCADPALLAPIVTDGASSSVNPSANGRVRDDAPAPDSCEKLIFADDAIAVPDQEFQEIEDQRLERKQLRSRSQLAALGVENHLAKIERQEQAPCRARYGCSPAVP